ncbi:gamma-glutamyltranspeptidase / glutathione hydrolase [Microbacterium sp. ru370.1]|uniref:gamma-glutamyltransferase family protein n=1 Tax=unclassified Microbacterium TaxID=2609290 RepID=UPI0008897B16|nr:MULTISPECIES: gamma-glutamyltransferase [unclassified Microbacterium]SDO83513.1 gamma-glutamyltranspeptidase / glutathione hydrolase [Microbacterium sp. ru370.1]SIT90195.1 gamma-glutamyltranspeptidase / glutathione hydrolase [Microbacterium sp. RU1D]
MTFTPPAPFTTRPTLRGTFGMSASTHWTATATAQAVLERGGNAFDAAVAGAFVLHVVEPHLNGPGGDLVALVRPAGASVPAVLMGQGPAPRRATIEHFRARGLDLVPGAGGLAAAVPGAVDAWLLLLRDHGTWELADVLAYAVGYARDGHPLVAGAAATIARVADLFRAHWPTSAERWMPTGGPPAPDTLVTNPAWADVLDSLVRVGASLPDRTARIDAARERWMTEVLPEAAAFIARPHRHADGADHPGILEADDLASWRAGYEPAVTTRFRGWDVHKAGTWSQGPALLHTLRLLDGADDAQLDPATIEGAHLVLEAQKLAFADRDAWFGDAGGAVEIDALLADEYVATRRAMIGAEASTRWRPGSPDGRPPVSPPLRTEHGSVDGSTGEPTVDRSGQTRGDTCHIDVIDRWGNVVSATPSGGWLQSSPTVPSLGFCLGTRLQATWLEPGHPASLTPGRRPRTTLTPTLVSRADEVIALGSPGGDQQDQWQLTVLLRLLVGGYSPQQAIDAPNLHTTALLDSFWPRTWVPAGVAVEDRLGDAVIAGLEQRGHSVRRMGDWSLGRVTAVGRDASGSLWAAANPRGAQGYAAGR